MSKLQELFLTKKELEKKKKKLMADGGGAGGGGGAGAGGGAGSGAGAGTGGGAGPGNSSGGGAHGSSSGMGGSAVSGDTGSSDSTPSAPAGFYGLGTMPSGKRKKKKKKSHFKFGGGIYEDIMPKRKVSDKHFDRKELPQVNIKHLAKSKFNYTFKEMDLDDIKPVQSQRVKGLVSSSEVLILKNKYKPLVVDKNGYLVNGHHRYDAANNLEMDEVNVVEVDANIDELIEYFKELASNTEIEEAELDFAPQDNAMNITTSSDNYKYDLWDFKNNPKMNLIDVLRLFIKDNAEQFVLGGLRFDWTKQQSQDYFNHSAGRKAILLMAKKVGYGENRHVTVRKELHKEKPNPGQGNLFTNFDNEEPESIPDLYDGPKFSKLELRLGSPIFEFARIGDVIKSHANRIERLRLPRMKLKIDIESRAPGEAGYNDRRDPKVIEYFKLKAQIDESLEIIRENIPDLVKQLYKVKDLLVQKQSRGERATPLESLDEFLKDILDEKIERNLKSTKS